LVVWDKLLTWEGGLVNLIPSSRILFGMLLNLMPSSRILFGMLLNLMQVDKVEVLSIIYGMNRQVLFILTFTVDHK
jgi:hypothetical protein